MQHLLNQTTRLALAGLCLSVASPAKASNEPEVSFDLTDREIVLKIDDRAVASYVFHDDRILRPYLAHVRTPSGVQVTRNHPPQAGDRRDHDTMHPGIWLAFGDVTGTDFWRNKGTIRHLKFSDDPLADGSVGFFSDLKRYETAEGTPVCDEIFSLSIRAESDGYLLFFDSQFSSHQKFWFGDQEEMGLGVRVATPISEKAGGRLLDSEGRQGAKQIWSRAAAWCDYSGSVAGKPAGITIIGHPNNHRTSWWHARDYGLVAANLFGRRAMKQGESSRIVVSPGEVFRLRYAIWIHDGADPSEIAESAAGFLRNMDDAGLAP